MNTTNNYVMLGWYFNVINNFYNALQLSRIQSYSKSQKRVPSKIFSPYVIVQGTIHDYTTNNKCYNNYYEHVCIDWSARK